MVYIAQSQLKLQTKQSSSSNVKEHNHGGQWKKQHKKKEYKPMEVPTSLPVVIRTAMMADIVAVEMTKIATDNATI